MIKSEFRSIPLRRINFTVLYSADLMIFCWNYFLPNSLVNRWSVVIITNSYLRSFDHSLWLLLNWLIVNYLPAQRNSCYCRKIIVCTYCRLESVGWSVVISECQNSSWSVVIIKHLINSNFFTWYDYSNYSWNFKLMLIYISHVAYYLLACNLNLLNLYECNS